MRLIRNKMKASIFYLTVLIFYRVAANNNETITRHHHLEVFNQPCKAVLVDVQNEKKDNENNKENNIFLRCEVPGDKSYRVPSADFDFINTNFINGPYKSAQTLLTLGPDAMLDSDKLEIIIPGGMKPALVLSDMTDSDHDLFGERRRLAVTGTFSVLVVRIVANDGGPSFTTAEISDAVFGTDGDPVNLVSQYKACSHGKLTFVPASGTGITNGAVTATVSLSKEAGGDALVDAAIDVLTSSLGRSPSRIADHVMFCMPPDVMNSIAWGYIHHWQTLYSDNWCKSLSIQMHEIGHNLGLGHSGADNSEYGDMSGMMGYSHFKSDGPLQCFNAAKMWQLGWFSARVKQLGTTDVKRYSGDVADMTQDPNDLSGPPIVIKLNTPTNQDYFLSYNRAINFNEGTYSGADTVRIVKTNQGHGTGYSNSFVVASLSTGDTWTSAADFDGEIATVKVNSIGTTANIEICIGSCPGSTPSAECEDFGDRFSFNFGDRRITRSCSWVAAMSTSLRCSIAGIAAVCPVACGTCSVCIDPDSSVSFRFEKDGNFIKRSCDWVTRKDTSNRCSLTNNSCRASCGVC